MTIVRGVRILTSPCCRVQFAFPRYVSMNFSAFEYWTDGWREHSLMPNDEGLRLCTCGQFIMLKDMVEVDTAEFSELPYMDRIPNDLLPVCIEKASSEEMEVAARLSYWRHLNHEYRDRYRQHRDAEEAATKTAWIAANPDRRTKWDKLLRRKPPGYTRSTNSPFTYPAFEPTDDQLRNMKRLSEILLEYDEASRRGYVMELAELYRELGLFEKAELMILTVDDDQVGVTSRLITRMIMEKQSAPMRYRM